MHQDRIEFDFRKSDLEDYLTTVIFINGIDLKDEIEKIETKQLRKKGFIAPNGCYEGISFFIAFHNQNHFLCKTLKDYIYQQQRYTLYDYKFSGIPGDHSLTCKIDFIDDEIVWYDFKNFSKIISFPFDYGNLKFHFSINQYIDAINSIRNKSI